MKNINELTELIKEWHAARGITVNGNSQTQVVKLAEELGELAAGVSRGKKKLIKDSIGDMFVVMVAIAELEGMTMQECIETAYNEIKDRKGYLNELGIFIKEEDYDS